MIALARNPSSRLSEAVLLLWYQEGYAPSHALESVLPDGSVELIVNLGADAIPIFSPGDQNPSSTARAGVALGPRSAPTFIATDQPRAIFGVHLRPGGAARVLGLPADELYNTTMPLETLWGERAGELRERLLECPALEARFDLLERFLLAHLGPPSDSPGIALAVAALEHARDPKPVAALASGLGWSSSRLLRTFRETVGLTPRTYLGVRRFQSAVRRLEANKRPDLAQVALECGYFDQSHLTNDFRALSGLTPGAYLERRGLRPGHPTADR